MEFVGSISELEVYNIVLTTETYNVGLDIDLAWMLKDGFNP